MDLVFATVVCVIVVGAFFFAYLVYETKQE